MNLAGIGGYFAHMKQQPMTVELPPELAARLRAYIAEGWAASAEEVVAEATRRYLWTHRPEVVERHLREDVAMALRDGK